MVSPPEKLTKLTDMCAYVREVWQPRGGLSRAYREAAAAALLVAPLAERFVFTRVRVVVPFDALGTVYRLTSLPGVLLVAEHYADTNEFEFDVRQSMVEEFLRMLRKKRLTTLP